MRRIERGHQISQADKISYWLSNHYMFLINLLLGICRLAFLAPILAWNGNQWGSRASGHL